MHQATENVAPPESPAIAPAEPGGRLRELEAHLRAARFDAAHGPAVGGAFRALVDAGFDRLPWPGGGHTARRWNSLAAVAGRDLSLVKLFEGHTDALAILKELCPDYHDSRTRPAYWGVWAAQGPACQVHALPQRGASVCLEGTKQWCSGARALTHALVTGEEPDGAAGLYAVALDQPGIGIDDEGWHAVGMHATASAQVRFAHACATRIGAPGAYLCRPGFWHGGAGIAACWYGAAAALARAVLGSARARPNPYRAAHLGSILVALGDAAAGLRESAAAIDRLPLANARWPTLRARLSVEHAAHAILDHASRALGAAPLCLDAQIARLAADLPVFMRQSHAEYDLAALGEAHANRACAPPSPVDALEQARLWQI